MTIWIKWLRLCQNFNDYMEKFFEAFVRFLTRHNKMVIVISLIISCGLVSGFFWFNQLHQSSSLYFPEKTLSWTNLDRTEKSFPSYVGFFDFIITENSNENVVTDNILKFALDVHNDVIKVAATKDNEELNIDSFCIKQNNECMYINILSLFGYNHSELVNTSSKLKMFYENKTVLLENGRNLEMMTFELLGNYKIKKNNMSAESVRFVYPVYFAKSNALYENNKVIENELQKIFQTYRVKASNLGFKLDYRTERSNDDAIDENSSQIVLVIIAITVMVTLCSLLTININKPVKGHMLLSLFGVLSVALGTGSAFGLVMLVGEPYVAFVGVLPFLVLAVGVDDMFIIIDEIDALDDDILGNERLAKAVKHVGASITITSLTDLIAFAVTAKSDLASVRYFCAYAALSIIFTFLMIMTFFISCFAFDIKRIENNRSDVIPFLKLKNENEESVWAIGATPISEKLMEKYARYLMKTPSKIIVVIVYIGLIVGGGYAASKVNLGFDQKEVAAEGSRELSWFLTIEKYFPSSLWTVNIIMQDESFNYASNKSINYFLNIDNYAKSDIHYQEKTVNWMSELVTWANKTNLKITQDNFYALLRYFLLIHPYFIADINFSLGKQTFLTKGLGNITSSRIKFSPNNNPLWSFHQEAMNNLRDYLHDIKKNKKVEFIAVSLSWIYLELLNVVPPALVKNLCICAATILVITLPYVWNPVISFLMLIMFGSISVLLIAVMYLWHVDLSGVSLIIIIMCIGFSVDYMAHIAHTYVLAQHDSADERMIYALKTMGKSVLKGGLSTFVGILITAFSKSKLFQIFFKMMFAIVGIGLLHGLMFLPVFLTIFARTKLNIPKENVVKSEDKNNVISNSYVVHSNEVISNKKISDSSHQAVELNTHAPINNQQSSNMFTEDKNIVVGNIWTVEAIKS